MIEDDQEFQTTTDRITRLQAQVAHRRQTETNPTRYRACVAGFLTEIDRIQLELCEYLSMPQVRN